ncbi:MAG: hypothetical protein ACI4JE_01980 [Ruminococcus sp.]
MNTRRYIAAFLAAVIGMSLTVGCGKEDSKDKEKESKSVSDSEKDESSDKNEESDKDEESEKDKDESSDKDTETTKRPSRTERWEISKAEEASKAEAEKTSREAAEKATNPTDSGSVDKPSNGAKTSESVCEEFLQAYIDNDANAVYSLFYEEETIKFYEWMNSMIQDSGVDMGGEESQIQALYSKDGVTEMIQSDIDQIQEIMASSGSGEWTVRTGEAAESDTSVDEFQTEFGMEIDDIVMYEDFSIYNKTSDTEITSDRFYNSTLYFIKAEGEWYLCFTSSASNYIIYSNFGGYEE